MPASKRSVSLQMPPGEPTVTFLAPGNSEPSKLQKLAFPEMLQSCTKRGKSRKLRETHRFPEAFTGDAGGLKYQSYN